MLSFFKWNTALMNIKEELDNLDALIAYRKMELGCVECADPRRRLTEAQQETLDTDPTLRDLYYKREYYLNKRLFLQQYGELPPEVEVEA